MRAMIYSCELHIVIREAEKREMGEGELENENQIE